MVYLPNVLVSNILGRLPADPYLLRFRIICKEWKYIIDDPVFAKHQYVDMIVIHIKEPKLLYMPLRSLLTCSDTIHVRRIQHNVNYYSFPSCHGLLLRRLLESHKVLILENLLTKERLDIPFPPLHCPDGIKICLNTCAASVGYDLATNDYKVVIPSNYISKDLIYSTKLGAWERITNRGRCHLNDRGVFAYGALHWLTMLDNENCIISLDLTSETYNKLQLPDKNFYPFLKLYELGGCLFLWAHIFNSSIRILWILQNYEGQKASWWNEVLRLHDNDMEATFSIEPLAYVKTTEQVLIDFHDKLMWFDVKKKKHMKTITIKGLKPNFCYYRIITVSLDCLTRTRGADDQIELRINTSQRLDSSLKVVGDH